MCYNLHNMKEIINEKYLNKLNNDLIISDTIKLIHDTSRDEKVPIIQDDGLDFLLGLVRLKKPKKILEIGTAVGFSAIMMARNSEAVIDTIERNQEMYNKALENIKKTNLENRINVHFGDALLIDENSLDEDYDIIFIDAAKAQNQKFFLKYAKLLKEDGIILTDNILFHGCNIFINKTAASFIRFNEKIEPEDLYRNKNFTTLEKCL